jgi:hypothetical protein
MRKEARKGKSRLYSSKKIIIIKKAIPVTKESIQITEKLFDQFNLKDSNDINNDVENTFNINDKD